MSTQGTTSRGNPIPNACRCEVYGKEIDDDLPFYKAAMSQIAEAAGIMHPLQLVAMTTTREQTYADVLAKHVKDLTLSHAQLVKALETAQWHIADRAMKSIPIPQPEGTLGNLIFQALAEAKALTGEAG